MAKKRKSAAARRASVPDAVERLVSQRDLRALMDQCVNHESKAATAIGNSRELVGEYVKNKNLHAPAFALSKRLYRLGKRDPGKLWLMLAHFDDYREKLGIDRMAKEQGQLLPAGAEIVRLPREVDETAGEAAE
jgi:hypothetical protein